MTEQRHPSEPAVAARLAEAMERLGEVSRVLLRQAATAEGLSVTQAQVLLRLRATADEPAQHGTVALARWLDVSAATVSDTIRALEQKGLVRRRTDSADPRRIAVRPTRLGVAATRRLARWSEPVSAALTESVAAATGDSTSAGLGELLEAALGAIAELQARGVVTVARTCVRCRFFDPSERDGSPYWCDLLDAPLAPATLRLDCADFQAGRDVDVG